jgi:hypothetical protein
MKYFLFALVLFLVGCGGHPANEIKDNNLYLKGGRTSYEVRVMEYDGCEYLVIGAGNNLTVAHKGNCKHCLERSKGK